MKKIIFFFVALLMFCKLNGQNKAKLDSLQNIISLNKQDTTNTKAYILISEYYQTVQLDSAYYYAIKAIQIAQQRKQNKMEAYAHNSLGYIQYFKGEYEKSIESFQNYFIASEKINDKKAMAFAKNNEGNVYIELGNYIHALDKYNEALALRKSINDSAGIAMSYNNIGYIYKDLGDYEKAISNFLLALKIYEELEDNKSIGVTYSYIGIVYWKKKDYALAHSYLDKSYKINFLNNDEGNMAINLHTKGIIYIEENKFDSARYYFEKAKAIYKKQQDIRQLAIIYQAIAELYQKQNNSDSTIYYYQKSISSNHTIQNKRSLGSLYIGIANAYLKKNDNANTKLYLDSAYQSNMLTQKKENWKDYYQILSDYYNKIGNTAYSLTSLKQFNLYKDSILNEENQKAIADMQTKYDVEKKNQQIILQKTEIAKKNYMLSGMVGIIILTILLAFSYYKRIKLNQKSRLQLEIMKLQDISTKMVLEAEERERKRIGSDLHDGIGQLMSAVKMNLSAIEDKIDFKNEEDRNAFSKSISLVDESCKEVRSVSHSIMPNALLRVGLSNAVKEFIEKLDNRLLKINLYSSGLNERIDSNIETVLYRVIQECINNVIKHSKANALDISLIKDVDGVSVTIEDNGKGFNVAEAKNKEGIGLKNMVARVKFLKGTLDIDSSPGKGTLIAIHVPTENK
ncbi:MAG: sensor histidine kinase [Chitinophagaceae bacterium]|nr:sensor histidine kinase [Chitinophagaceae bacterium]HMN32024.1 sensor histidine kinase [Chitinophagaceae bacterium]